MTLSPNRCYISDCISYSRNANEGPEWSKSLLKFILLGAYQQLGVPRPDVRPDSTIEELEEMIKKMDDRIYLVDKHDFNWKVENGRDRKKTSYSTDILYFGHAKKVAVNRDSKSSSESSRSDLRILLEKTCMSQFPVPIPETPPVAMTLKRKYVKEHQDYIISFCVNLDNELFQRIFSVMNKVCLITTLAIAGETPAETVTEVLEILMVKGEHQGIVERPFARGTSVPINKLLWAYKDVKGTFSVQLLPGSGENVVVPVTDKFESFNLCRKLFDEKNGSDCVMVAENGCEIDCHSAILCVHSDVFTTMLTIDMKESRTRKISTDLSENTLNALLKFLYYWDTSVPSDDLRIALDLLKAAHQYGIKTLESSMQTLFALESQKPAAPGWAENFHVDHLLELYMFADCVGVEYDEVKAISVKLMKKQLGELKKSSLFQKIFKDNPKIAQEIYFLSFDAE